MTTTLVNPIPAHLKRYVSKQDYEQYTPINQAVWRYVMRQNYHYFKKHSHASYQDGLFQSGILIDRIPRVEEMDACLKPFGWGAVPIDGLIPGVAFFDFQAHGLLPIATDLRTLDHIAYTPTPDIIHEAAGHAPILCDPEYAYYVKRFGEIGAKALSNQEELEVFKATRLLSQLMEKPDSTPDQIKEAEQLLQEKIAQVTEVSEATLISRLYWWTVEYGLIGSCEQPKIYGAGLLSSMGEGQNCLSDQIKKIPFDLEKIIDTDYDVTRPQPQLFVCDSFQQLVDAVEQLSKRMAFQTGGTEGLRKALRSADTATAQYHTGLQVTGTFTDLIYDGTGEAIYLKTTGPTSLSYHGSQIPHHGKETHADGFGAPIGKCITPISTDLKPDSKITIQYESGVCVEGRIVQWFEQNGQVLLLSLIDCTVSYQEQILFHPEWGTYDLAIGSHISSVFAGAADPEHFFQDETEATDTKLDATSCVSLSTLDHLYQAIREIREGEADMHAIENIIQTLDDQYPQDWLLRIEILELFAQTSNHKHARLEQHVNRTLHRIAEEKPELKMWIERGLDLLKQS
ncbi:aromatic amino acid hydroxylase [Hazenella sp. IB182357]|uniref:Aromatic amino acid hydroxylase n=1 Tax=Polycladospora coralii TaxID=2771432 RepID=A0A926N4S6_9BACL|nr:aromatic amino acid hydroxylase [Polycladospora coralii]MBD1370909.1 aromatic amino acid hydroxylase [Polycladospora coralii]MBS7529848.1 aromatic amino acid hydroxylase [Polycladospora coralii]